MTILQQKLKAIMAARKWNAPELARRAGLPLASIKSILQGRSKNPRTSTVTAIARACGCAVEELFTPVSDMPVVVALPVVAETRSVTALPRNAAEDGVEVLSMPDGYSIALFKKTLRAVEEASVAMRFSFAGRDLLRHHICSLLYKYALEEQAEHGGRALVDMVLAYWLVEQERDKALTKAARKRAAKREKKSRGKKARVAKRSVKKLPRA